MGVVEGAVERIDDPTPARIALLARFLPEHRVVGAVDGQQLADRVFRGGVHARHQIDVARFRRDVELAAGLRTMNGGGGLGGGDREVEVLHGVSGFCGV